MTEVIGVIGGIGSGKSAVSAAFERCGAVILDADAIAHEVLGKKETLDALRRTFGNGIFDEDGGLDRPALSARVFGPENREALECLNGIVHPAVRVELDSRLQRARAEGVALVVLDIPLLLNSRYRNECDHIVFVETDRETRLERVRRRNWSAEELDRRESSQLPLAEKKAASDFVLVNEGTPEELDGEVRKLYNRLVVS